MDKVFTNINELLKFNHKTVADFEGREYLRGKCPDCPPGKSPALSIHKSLIFARCFRCSKLFINKGMHYEDIICGTLGGEVECPSICGVTHVPNPMIEILYEKVPKEGIEYLVNRNKYVTDWTKYRLGYDESSVFIPYYYMDRFIFYQLRYYTGDRRYNMPSLPSPLYLPHEWDITLPTIICEGPFDAIALDTTVGDLFNIVAVIGKELTKYKLRILSNLSTSNYYVMLDEYELSEDLINKNKYLDDARVIYSDGPDPEELLNSMGLEKFRQYIIDHT